MRVLTWVLFLGISLTFSFKSFAIDTKRFCLVEIPVKGLSGIAAQEHWRAVAGITVFENSPHPIFYSFNGHTRMRLDGYSLVAASEEDIPWNILFEKTVIHADQFGKIYAQGRLWGKDIGTRKLNYTTGKFELLSEDEAAKVSSHLQNLASPQMILKSGEELTTDYLRTQFSLISDQGVIELPRLYGTDKRPPNAAYYPQVKEYFAYGRLKETTGNYLEPKFYKISDGKWTEVAGSENIKNPQFILPALSSKKYALVQNFSNGIIDVYYADNFGTLKLIESSIPVKGLHGTSYDITFLNKTLYRTFEQIFKLNEREMAFEEISVPEKLRNEKIYSLIEMPESKVVLIIGSNNIYMMDENYIITEEPVFNMALLGIGEKAYIPVRKEVFLSSKNGEHLLIDKNFSDEKLCNIQSNKPD